MVADEPPRLTDKCSVSGKMPVSRRLFGLVRKAVTRLMLLSISLLISSTIARGEAVGAVIKTVNPHVLSGRVVSLSLTDGLVVELGERRRHIDAPDLVRITFAEGEDTPARRTGVFHLSNGDLIHGRILNTDDDSLLVDTPGWGEIAIPLDALAGIDRAKSFEASYIESARWLQDKEGNGEDRVLLTNGDVLRGVVSSIDAESLSIESASGESKVALRLVVAIRFAETTRALAVGPRCIVLLRDGGRITSGSLAWDAGRLSLKPWNGSRIDVPVDRIARLEFEGGRWSWLGDHRPISYEHTPMLSLAWELQVNRNVAGGPMVVGGERYAHGIGVHSRCSITFDLEGAYKEFVTSFGLDDTSGMLADVSVAIRIDGQPRYDKNHVRPGNLYGPVRLDLHGAKTIELMVDFGENGDLQDRFDWVEPALVR